MGDPTSKYGFVFISSFRAALLLSGIEKSRGLPWLSLVITGNPNCRYAALSFLQTLLLSGKIGLGTLQIVGIFILRIHCLIC